jgi:two-component system sensor histidine kinase/response regulator
MKNTELVGMNECFQKDYREIAKMFESVNRTKSAFLANMSHVIRTPINEIIGMAEIVSDTELLSQQRYYLEMIKSSAYFLLKVVNDVLDYSKIEAGILELDNITFSLRHSLNSVMDIFTLRAQKKDIQLVYSIDSDIPDTLIGDPSRFRQIIYNLVDNAVKYTKYGDIHVTVQSEYETDNTVYLRVIVSDKGVGIPLEMQKMIFEAFTHVGSSHKRSQTGSGLGLAISKQLVEMMGGRMWLESTLGDV